MPGSVPVPTRTVGRVLVVEDDDAVRFGLTASLRRHGFAVSDVASRDRAISAFLKERPDVVVSDLRLGDGDAFELLSQLRAIDRTVPIYIITGYGSIDSAVRAVKEGAEDFLTKPIDTRRLIALLSTAIEKRRTRASGKRPKLLDAFESRSPLVRDLEMQVERLRDADCSVLVLGETGTGKSVLARRIHAIGARSTGPFVDVNCAGLTKEFVESELFGHDRGAFTGAHTSKTGLLEEAKDGTLFLDEIGDIDLQVQPKVLKVLEEKRFRRMGDVRERSVDVRLVAATHHDLLAAVANKTFRADLFYRISTVTLNVPPLRHRLEDLLPLAEQILTRLGGDASISPDAGRRLLEHDWPGNIRELKNVLERARLLRTGTSIQADDLRFDTPSTTHLAAAVVERDFGSGAPSSRLLAEVASSATRDEIEREHISLALSAENGRVEAAARRLGVSRSSLYQKLKTYGIVVKRGRGKE